MSDGAVNDEGIGSGSDEEEVFINEEAGEEVILGEGDQGPPPEDSDNEGEGENLPSEDKIIDLSTKQFTIHTDAIYSVSFSPINPSIFASGGGDEIGFLWDINSPEAPLYKLTGHTDTVSQISFSSDGKYLATGGMDALCKIWDPSTGTLLHTLEGPSEAINCMQWHSRGPVIFAGGTDGIGWMWNAAQGKVMNVFSAHSQMITDATFSTDGKKIVTVSEDGTLKIWDPKNAQAIYSLGGNNPGGAINFHSGSILSVRCHSDPDSGLILTGGGDNLSTLVNMNTGKVMANYSGHKDSIESTAFIIGFPCCVTGSMDKTIQVWDINTQITRSTMQHDEGIIKVLTTQENPNILMSCSIDSTIRLWDFRNGGCIKKLTGHTDQILDFHYANYNIISASEDHTLRLWDIRNY